MNGYFLSLLSIILLFGQSSCSTPPAPHVSVDVHAPAVYVNAQHKIQALPPVAEKERICPGPAPYRGVMIFRSRYEGSGHARDQINAEAENAYMASTRSFTELQHFMANETDAIIKRGMDKRRMECILNTLISWKKNSSLLRPTKNHTGRAVRKWTLAAISANLLKINLLAEAYDKRKFAAIKEWIADLAAQVVHDYSDLPLKKINNHSYWAAWSVMTSAALLNRNDLFSWSARIYATAMEQINEEGFLANELRRNSRALLYHNYALTPLTGMAAFLQANNSDPFLANNGALQRLVNVVLAGVDDPNFFRKATGVAQVPYNLHIKGRLSWLAIYLSLDNPLISHRQKQHMMRICLDSLPLRASRLGGDVGFLYLGL